MNFSSKNRLNKGASRRFVISILLISWLNLAAQPCLMAMQPGQDSSATTEHSVDAVHSEHRSGSIDAPDCNHCPPVAASKQAPCETGSVSDCEMFPGPSMDGRQFELKVKDFSPQLAVSVPPALLGSSAALVAPLPRNSNRLKFTGDPALNLLFCVFLK